MKNKNLNVTAILTAFIAGVLIIALSVGYLVYKNSQDSLRTFLIICYSLTSVVGVFCIACGFRMIYTYKKNLKVIKEGRDSIGEYVAHYDEKKSGNYLNPNLMYIVQYKYEDKGKVYNGKVVGLTLEEALTLRVVKNFKVKCLDNFSFVNENIRELTFKNLDKIKETKSNYLKAMNK